MPWMEQAHLLLRKAHDDATALNVLAKDPGIIDAIVGFHAPQAVEKGLKAVLSARGVDYPRTHNLEALFNLLIAQGLIVPQAVDDAMSLSPFADQWRYDDPPENDLDRNEALALVRSVLVWCDQEVGP